MRWSVTSTPEATVTQERGTSDTLTTLASGTVTAPGTGTWQHLAVTFNGSSISAAINCTTVASVTDATCASGMVGFGTSGYQTGQFDNLSVPLAGSATPTGHIIAGDDTAECADVNGGRLRMARRCRCVTVTAMGTCNGGANQQWIAVNGELVNPVSGRCVLDPGFNTTQGTQFDLWSCNGGSNQQWSVP